MSPIPTTEPTFDPLPECIQTNLVGEHICIKTYSFALYFLQGLFVSRLHNVALQKELKMLARSVALVLLQLLSS